jgi:hypothetical protein
MKPKKIISLKKLNGELKKEFTSLYKNNYADFVTEFKDPRDNKIHKAVPLETADAIYLVLVDQVKMLRQEHVMENEEHDIDNEEHDIDDDDDEFNQLEKEDDDF